VLLMKWYKEPAPGLSKTWDLFGKTDNGNLFGTSLFRLVGSLKQPFRWRLPESNPYLRTEVRNTVTSYYGDVAMAVSHN
jgi:RNA-directed DNA polymerase